MEVNVDDRRLAGDGAVSEMIAFLRDNEANLGLARAQLYYDFPVLKDADGRVVVAKVLLLSQSHGVVAMATTDTASADRAEEELRDTDQELDHVFSLIYSRLIRNRQLRRSKTELLIPASTLIFAPNLDSSVRSIELESPIALSTEQLGSILNGVRRAPVSDSDFAELVATIEGAKGIIRPHPRDVSALSPRSKGVLANKIESEITSFDRRQKHGAMPVLDGLQRVRGLAGSGKTVVLAMKAALTHLREPEASIVYTFYTKSLYQHIQRLITRFYRQFEDRDPDWSRLRILHGWGGFSGEGVYFNACQANRVSPLTLSEARVERARDPFDYACKKLLDATEIKPMYDFVLVDEGQDFPASFVRLCTRLAEKNRVILAYDDLQTIFQTSTPRLEDIVGTGPDGRPSIGFTEDVILYKCYRNPREILVCAHALGLGLYGNIVQMLENREQWEDIGYRVLEGDFVEGSPTNIERPEENSLPTISMQQRPSEIVSAVAFRSYDEEVDSTVNAIQDNLRDGLRPDDILVKLPRFHGE